MDVGQAPYGAVEFPDRGTVIPILLCPDDPANPKVQTFSEAGWQTQGFSGNMVVCAGSTTFNPGGPASSERLDGLFSARRPVAMADVRDGVSSTALVSELILARDVGGHDLRGRYYNPTHGGVMFSGIYPPNTRVPDRISWTTSQTPPRAPAIWPSGNADLFALARSHHAGGVNLALADGAVRFLSDLIDPDLFKALTTRKSRESTPGLD